MFVNGRHVPYTTGVDETLDVANGYCKPFLFDVTDAVAANAENTLAILATRTFINELGTGGLMAPVTLVAEQ